MRDVQESFARLDLSSDADAGTIRRAYARALKQIDQQQDVAGFQALREAYELALAWARHSERPQPALGPEKPVAAPFMPAMPAPAPMPGKPESTPEQLAQAVFDHFLATCAGLAVTPPAEPGGHWHGLLQRQLDDDRLTSLMARAHFEGQVVQLLASGWRPGHDRLFAAAVAVFGWLDDGRALARFGRAGALLNQAVEESQWFDAMPEREHEAKYKLESRLRDPRPPTDEEMRRYRFHLETMTERFPAFLAVVVDADNLQRWLFALQDMPSRLPPPEDPDAAETPAAGSYKDLPILNGFGYLLIGCFVLLFLTIGVMSILDPSNAPVPPRNSGDAPQQLPVTSAQVNAIASRINYLSRPGAGAGTVAYEVFLLADRSVLGVNKKQSSGDPAFDDAVEQAIRTAPPFPPNTITVFTLSYSNTQSAPAN